MMDENKVPDGMDEQNIVQPPEIATEAAAPGGGGTQGTPEETAPATEDAQIVSPMAEIVQDPVGDALAPARKKLPVALLAVIAVLIVAVIAAFASGMFANPEKAVRNAFAATGAAQEKRLQKITNEIPILKDASGTAVKAEKTNFDISFQSVKGEGLPSEAAMFSKLFAGLGVRGSAVSDPANKTFELDGAFGMADASLIDLYFYGSPDKLAFSVPSFADTALSINPKTLAADAKASALYDAMYMDDAQLAKMQELLNGQFEAMGALDKAGAKKMQDDIRAIADKALVNAVYKKGEKVDGMNTYTVTVPGTDVKTALLELIRYMYLESPVTGLYKTIFTPILPSGESYEVFMERDVITPMQSMMPDMDAVLTLGVNKVVKTAKLVLVPAAPFEDESASLDSITVDYDDTENGQKIVFTIGMTSYELPVAITVDLTETFADSVYAVDLGFGMTGLSSLDMDYRQNITLDKTGACKVTAEIKAKDGITTNSVTDINFKLNLDGTIMVDGDKKAYDFPDIVLEVGMTGVPAVSVNFAAKVDTAPAESPYAASRPSKEFFKMTEAELETEINKYSTGMEHLYNNVFEMLMGGDSFAENTFGGTPEPGLTEDAAPDEAAAA